MTSRHSIVCVLLTASACFNPQREDDTDGSNASASSNPTMTAETACLGECTVTDTSGRTTGTGSLTTDTGGLTTGTGSADTEAADTETADTDTADASTTSSDAESTTRGMDSTGTTDTGATEAGETETGAALVEGLRDGLVLLMPMEEEAWAGILGEVRDASGRQNHGTVTGGATTTIDGRFGRAGVFDGASWIEIPDHATLRPSTGLTISAWVRPTNLGTSESYGIVSKRLEYGSQTAYTLYLSTEGQPTCDIQLEDDRFYADTQLVDNRWTHIAVVFDGTLSESERVRMYIDGELEHVAPESSAMIDPEFGADLRIGDLPGGGQPFIGQIDEVAIWSRALSEEEMVALWGLAHSLAVEE